ncbi:MAG: nuclear transport factor 2 family protein [Hyphomicrobiales bacterium]|nr:nuclear transport factor 2 family protein [Hyphomicrobiales bacterium]
MTIEEDQQAVRQVVIRYLEGMIYGQDDYLREAMHPLCMQAGHYGGQYEFMPRDEFIEAIKPLKKEPDGSAFTFDIQLIDITGDIALAKVKDDCFGTSWTDYLTLIKHEGNWQIVMKAFFDHANDKQG